MSRVELFEIYKILLKKRITLFRYTFIFFVIGIIISLVLPKSYKSSMKFTFSQPKGEKSSVSTLASLAGININSNESNILSPGTYNIIISDHIFKRSLLKTYLEDSLTFKDYLTNNSFDLFKTIKNNISVNKKIDIIYNLI